mgnify:CR=1 FL=1|tara:strand:- start:1307 stop:1711 length:405 start_codon:yes stop_codon:yes gene_type:complete
MTTIVENDVELNDVLPKYKEPNPRNYTEMQLARKRLETRQMVKQYPEVSPQWIGWCWDFIENTSKERIAEIIETKEFENRPQKEGRQSKGGQIYDAITKTTRTEEEVKDREYMINDFEKIEGRQNPLPLEDTPN